MQLPSRALDLTPTGITGTSASRATFHPVAAANMGELGQTVASGSHNVTDVTSGPSYEMLHVTYMAANGDGNTISLRRDLVAMQRAQPSQSPHSAKLGFGAGLALENAAVFEVCSPLATAIFGTLQLAFKYSVLAPAREAEGTPACMSRQCLQDLCSSCRCDWTRDADALGDYPAQAVNARRQHILRVPEGPQVQLHVSRPH